MFTGTIEGKLDAKGRVFFPAAFRKQLTGDDVQWVMKRDAFAACLVIYPYAAWEAEVSDLRGRLNRWNPAEAMAFRQFMTDVEVFSLDSNGRFILPQRYRQATDIEREVTFLGLDDRIEVWPTGRMAAPFLTPDEMEVALQKIMTREP